MKLILNGSEREFPHALSLADLVEQLGMTANRVAAELNREIISRDQWSSTKLREGDRLELVHFVGGGCAPAPK